jgi:hypothetical protein
MYAILGGVKLGAFLDLENEHGDGIDTSARGQVPGI